LRSTKRERRLIIEKMQIKAVDSFPGLLDKLHGRMYKLSEIEYVPQDGCLNIFTSVIGDKHILEEKKFFQK